MKGVKKHEWMHAIYIQQIRIHFKWWPESLLLFWVCRKILIVYLVDSIGTFD